MTKYIVVRNIETIVHEYNFPADEWTVDTAMDAENSGTIPAGIDTEEYTDVDIEVFEDEW